MSRVGKKPIVIPANVELNLNDESIKVKGPKGELTLNLDSAIKLIHENQNLILTNDRSDKDSRAKHGLYRALIQNLITGVVDGFKKELSLVGVGYRAQMKGQSVELSVGYSHPVVVDPLEGVSLKVEGNNKIIIEGIDKQKVGQQAADIRKIRKPNPYKGKGIRYVDEVIIKKAGKSVKK